METTQFGPISYNNTLNENKNKTAGIDQKSILHLDLNRLLYTDYIDICPIELGDALNKDNCFGMKALLETIKEYFDLHKINKEAISPRIEKAISDTQLTDITRNNVLLSKIGNMSIFLRNCQNKAIELVFSILCISAMSDSDLSIGLSPDIMNICLKQIAELYHYPITDAEIKEVQQKMQNEISEVTISIISDLVKKHKLEKFLKIVSKDHLISVCAYFHYAKCLIEYIEGKMDVNYMKILILKTIDEINEGIDGLAKLYDHFSSLENEMEDEFIYDA